MVVIPGLVSLNIDDCITMWAQSRPQERSVLNGFMYSSRQWRYKIFKSLFGKSEPSPPPTVVRDLSDLKPYLLQAGYSIEDREPLEILGIRMERVRMRQSRAVSAVGFGGGYFHIVQMIGLARTLTPKEVVGFNASVQMFNVTPSEEPPAAIIKTHVPARFGALPQTIIALLSYSDNAVEKLITAIGSGNVRAI
ncbi:hypothetical protein [Rhizobium ruizarguesonis]|uniref:hypothetical protein n=1 Tax=Rhizobium ruizarguesonis TaxID=2081791 RepID=UPI001030DB1D|nr:hypothetical protein [Rhizobium ruizarguesonis]TBA03102.1 hypothetical protein ELH64_01095 [Rhizobium ruizarguesonis]